MTAAFAASLEARSAGDYADFFLPHISNESLVLDAGCGEGTITLGLADAAGRVVGIDPSAEAYADAQRYAHERGITNVEFRVGSVYDLDFPADHFDGCLCHSVVETLARPLDGLGEIRRTLRPGAVLGVACVEYGGLILAGPNDGLLRRFYTIRERLWLLESGSDPYCGRRLRGLLAIAGFESVVATSKFFSYGTPEAVDSFGRDRAAECSDGWYARSARSRSLATAGELGAMRRAWLEWSRSPDAYLAFAWCRALGRKPGEA